MIHGPSWTVLFFDPLLIKPSSHEYFVARNSSSSLLITLFIFLASRTMYMFDACLNVFGDFVQNFFRCLSFFFFDNMIFDSYYEKIYWI